MHDEQHMIFGYLSCARQHALFSPNCFSWTVAVNGLKMTADVFICYYSHFHYTLATHLSVDTVWYINADQLSVTS